MTSHVAGDTYLVIISYYLLLVIKILNLMLHVHINCNVKKLEYPSVSGNVVIFYLICTCIFTSIKYLLFKKTIFLFIQLAMQ